MTDMSQLLELNKTTNTGCCNYYDCNCGESNFPSIPFTIFFKTTVATEGKVFNNVISIMIFLLLVFNNVYYQVYKISGRKIELIAFR